MAGIWKWVSIARQWTRKKDSLQNQLFCTTIQFSLLPASSSLSSHIFPYSLHVPFFCSLFSFFPFLFLLHLCAFLEIRARPPALPLVQILRADQKYCGRPGAIIGGGDRKSWDPRGPMIWDNFSIFWTNCAILTSDIRANPRTCRGFSRVCCHVAWSKMARVASFHNEGREIRQGGITRAVLCTFMLWVNGKCEFFRVENFSDFAIWMNNICSRLYA